MEKKCQNFLEVSEKPDHSNEISTLGSEVHNNCIISANSFNYEIYIDLIEAGTNQDIAVYAATGTETLEEARQKIDLKSKEH